MVFSERAMINVKIVYRKQSCQVEVDDISPESLQEYFDLPNPPTFLVDEKESEIIDSKYWKSELKPGSTYRIKEHRNTSDKDKLGEKETAKKTGISDTLSVIVSHAVAATTAAYKMKHNEGDDTLIKQYMQEDNENRFFEYIILSKNGKNVYLIAKEKGEKRIYIAIQATDTGVLLDLKCNLQVTLHYFFISIYSNSLLSNALLEEKFFPDI